MTFDDISAASDSDLADPLRLVADSCYRWGDLQAIRYDRDRAELFPPPYLVELYNRTAESGFGRLGVLPALFCGMKDLSCEAIAGYLNGLPLIVLGRWEANYDYAYDRGEISTNSSTYFHPLGYAFPTSQPILAARQWTNANSVFAGYTFFRESWSKPEQTILTYLGLSYLFQEFSLASIHGVRYADNHLTARWTKKFGFRDVGVIPDYLYRNSTGKLASATISTLARADFADLFRDVLIKLREEAGGEQGVTRTPAIATEESATNGQQRQGIDASDNERRADVSQRSELAGSNSVSEL